MQHASDTSNCCSAQLSSASIIAASASRAGAAFAWSCHLNIVVIQAQHYRSYLYREVSASYLDWHLRRSAIIAELAHLQPDIICLQEVDRYDDLQAELQQLG
eukprot:GHRR01023078.1.p1 GENE.GHRR01023078.1~~GHRR01023078.1.p1  ORF type:complete len:102 (-),score=40.32 GHRR01023078.1:65-370(-)